MCPPRHNALRALLLTAAVLLTLSACNGNPQNASLEELLSRIDGRLNDAEPEMVACFQREIAVLGEQINGRIVVRVEIDSDGLVQNLTIVESELGDELADQCVADTIRRIYFDEWVDRKPVRVTKPYMFIAGQ